MSSEIIKELAESNGLSIEEATSLLIAVLGDVEKDKKKSKCKKKETYIRVEYVGKVTFTCSTCSTVFNRTFTTNVKDQHLHKPAPTCTYCRDALNNKSKEDLIVMILSDRKDIKRIA